MKNKANEWVSISDLMSGVMAVVMLFFVVSTVKSIMDKAVMNQQVEELKQQVLTATEQENRLKKIIADNMVKIDSYSDFDKEAKLNAEQEKKLVEMLNQLENTLSSDENNNLLYFNVEQSKVILKDSVFSLGSACITHSAQEVIPSLNRMVARFLTDFPSGRVYIEGHTDNRPVKKPVTDIRRYCTVYDDNYTLSAARAREARKLLIDGLNGRNFSRIVVAGFGSSNPIDLADPSSARNRRVEVRFVLNSAN
ncbi:OmpA/MotB family protein [Vibrio nitrifigilis]|uniref:OmpA family protein n=1 Tax=Vibrio nitrifigilis TaxID=2789781 RepID=A0ABS0GI45_9VIBR|nr:OmpA family protein [Vibrio nitrifigilis]MBF9002103.1 OmpA family protein [Vibrio nitrifigilis]